MMNVLNKIIPIAFLVVFTQSIVAQNVDEIIQPYVKTNNFSGAILISQNGKTLLSKAYGMMNRTYHLPNVTDTKFYLASVSMIFTSAAILKLVEEKRLALNDPLSKYLPDYKYGKDITLHHLLSQRSGIPGIEENSKANYDSITKFAHTPEKLINYFKDDSPLFKPDSKYNHGKSDYILLAYIIEKVTGKSFGDYLKEAIFDPLKMTNSGHNAGEKQILQNIASGYSAKEHYDVENAPSIDWSSKTGHGSIYSTVNDLNKFAMAILKNQLLSAESWRKIFTNAGNNVGYGWFIRDHLDRKRVQMNGRSPGFSSYFSIYPDDKLVIVVLSNNYISLPTDIGLQLAAWALKKPVTLTKLSTTPLNATQAGRLVGKYKFDEKFYRPNFEMEISFRDGNLYSSWGALIPVEEDHGPLKSFILRPFWSTIKFVQNREGEIIEMDYDGFRGIKISK
ncbi:MAG TPA: serine hydrolase domain-containing protein [Chitinophagaceae bacterium]|nr:serine hydrolase domain-containing protein [Chitinophagaceae bacterium]